MGKEVNHLTGSHNVVINMLCKTKMAGLVSDLGVPCVVLMFTVCTHGVQ